MLTIADSDKKYLDHAIELALGAEREGNLPVGAVIVLADEIIATGKNKIWVPKLDYTRHAEIEAIKLVPESLWKESQHMTLYTTLEPCLMCASVILLYKVGKTVFGASDSYSGATCSLEHMPPYFKKRLPDIQWIGPVLSDECDKLLGRLFEISAARKD